MVRWRQPLSLWNLLALTENQLHYHWLILQDTISTNSWSSDLFLPPFCFLYTGLKIERACCYKWHLKFGCAVIVVLLPVSRWKMGDHSLQGEQGLYFNRKVMSGHPFRLLSVVWRWSSPLREEASSIIGCAVGRWNKWFPAPVQDQKQHIICDLKIQTPSFYPATEILVSLWNIEPCLQL